MALLIIEPFYGGSHAQLVDWLIDLHCVRVKRDYTGATPAPPVLLLSLPAKKWHWRLRASSIWAADAVPWDLTLFAGGTLLCSSMLNLAELLALRPDIRGFARMRTVVYFHENQLAYPMRAARGERAHDTFHFGWAQIMSTLAADICAFNSTWNMQSFISAIDAHCRMVPDSRQRVAGVADRIAQKAVVAHFPVTRAPATLDVALFLPSHLSTSALRIVWPHRWEYDKAPSVFFAALAWLHAKKVPFVVAVLGESFNEVPPDFSAAHDLLAPAGHVAHWGYVASKREYFAWLSWSDVVVSTADHEFFGVSTVEAVLAGAYPLLPARLSYPELVAPAESELAATAPSAVMSRMHSILTATAAPWGSRTAPDASSTEAAATPTPSAAAGESAPHQVRTGQYEQDGTLGRNSCHLYKSERDLRQRLYALARAPAVVREWSASVRKHTRELEDVTVSPQCAQCCAAAPPEDANAAGRSPNAGMCSMTGSGGERAVNDTEVESHGRNVDIDEIGQLRPSGTASSVPVTSALKLGCCCELVRTVSRFHASKLAPIYEVLLYK